MRTPWSRLLHAALRGRYGWQGVVAALVVLLVLFLGLERLLGPLVTRLLRCLERCRRQVPRGHEPTQQGGDCTRIPPFVHHRPDPMIYSQEWLVAKGIGVTYDNPDIDVMLGGAVVPSHALEADTQYTVRARIWNASIDAPAVGVPVDFSFLSFGIGTASTSIGSDQVDLPVKGSPGLPALAEVPWRTPTQAGHYCLQARIVWGDDADPGNNMGQENTDVKALNSPAARFAFTVRNDTATARTLALEADAYALGELPPCDDRPRDPRADHARSAHPVPHGWTVSPEPRELRLEPGAQRDVEVEVVAPDDFDGHRSFNVHAFDGHRLAGGVTLTVHGRAAD